MGASALIINRRLRPGLCFKRKILLFISERGCYQWILILIVVVVTKVEAVIDQRRQLIFWHGPLLLAFLPRQDLLGKSSLQVQLAFVRMLLGKGGVNHWSNFLFIECGLRPFSLTFILHISGQGWLFQNLKVYRRMVLWFIFLSQVFLGFLVMFKMNGRSYRGEQGKAVVGVERNLISGFFHLKFMSFIIN